MALRLPRFLARSAAPRPTFRERIRSATAKILPFRRSVAEAPGADAGRRAVMLGGAATAVVLPLPAFGGGDGGDDAQLLALWRERVDLIREGRRLSQAGKKAQAALPWWAASGPSMIDHEGKHVGFVSGWPARQNATPAAAPGETLRLRVCPYDIAADYRQRVALHPETRPAARAAYRQAMREYIALRRAQRAEEARVNLPALNAASELYVERMDANHDAILEAAGTSPNGLAARLMLSLALGAIVSEGVEEQEPQWCLIVDVLRSLEPQTSGIVREHVAALLADPEAPLRDLPFVA